MKKGLEWEVIPEKREAVDREMELYRDNLKTSNDSCGGGGSNNNSSITTAGGDKGTASEHGKETDYTNV